MSEKSASCGEQGIDRLLAEAGLDEAYEIRPELLELRALAGARPQPSAAVQALMVPARVAAVPCAAAPAPVDELAARRRQKGRMTFAAVAVAASLAAGATAAAASDGGIPGTIEHLGAAVGSVVKQLTPGSGGNAPRQQGTSSEQGPTPSRETSVPASPTPVPSSTDTPGSSTHPTPQSTPTTTAAGSRADSHKGLQDVAKGRQGPAAVPTPVVPTPSLPLPQPLPSEILPGNPLKP